MIEATTTSCCRQVGHALRQAGAEASRCRSPPWERRRSARDAAVAVAASVAGGCSMACAALLEPRDPGARSPLMLVMASLVPLASLCLLAKPTQTMRRFAVLLGVTFAAAEAAAAGIAVAASASSSAVLLAWRLAEASAFCAFGLFVAARCASAAAPPARADDADAERDRRVPIASVSASLVRGFSMWVAWAQAFFVFCVALNVSVGGGPREHAALVVSVASSAVLPAYQQIMVASTGCSRGAQLAFVAFALASTLAQLAAGIFVPVIRLLLAGGLLPSCIDSGECLTLALRTYIAVVLSAAIGVYSAYTYL